MEDKETYDDVSKEDETEEGTNDSDVYTPKEEYTYEEVVAMEARLKKAEAALVEKKRAEKEAKKQKAPSDSTTQEGNYITKQELAIDKFIDKNPEMEDYREDIVKHLSRGLSITEAKVLIDNSDAMRNREKTKKMSISYSDGGSRLTSITKDQLANMSQAEYNNARELMKNGKLILK